MCKAIITGLLVLATIIHAQDEKCFTTSPEPPGTKGNTSLPQNSVMIPGVPNYHWSRGCGPTSAGMLIGYWAKQYPFLVDGDIPDKTVYGDPIPEFIVSSSHVRDYWVGDRSLDDPFDRVRAPHRDDCLADFMGSNQAVRCYNRDGESKIFYSDSSRKYRSSSFSDAVAGIVRYAESRGVHISEWYTQLIDTETPDGFSFEDWCERIDAGQPVLVLFENHLACGVGYSRNAKQIIIHDTMATKPVAIKWGERVLPFGRHVGCIVIVPGNETKGPSAVYRGIIRIKGEKPYHFFMVFETNGEKITGAWQVTDRHQDPCLRAAVSLFRYEYSRSGTLYLPSHRAEAVISAEDKLFPEKIEGKSVAFYSPWVKADIDSLLLRLDVKLTGELNGMETGSMLERLQEMVKR